MNILPNQDSRANAAERQASAGGFRLSSGGYAPDVFGLSPPHRSLFFVRFLERGDDVDSLVFMFVEALERQVAVCSVEAPRA